MADLKISELTDYTSAVDADILPIVDTTLSTTKKISWANIKATLKTYFDGIYTAAGGANTALSNLSSVAINTTLVSDTDNTDSLGTAAIAWSDLFLGNESVITWSSAPNTPDITLTHSANLLTLSGGGLTINGAVTATAATITASTIQANTAITTDSVDGAPIGDATHSFSDLFLASGAVINFDNGNATLTHSTGLLTSNVPLSLGTSNALTCGTIELGHASDTTLARVSAGVISVEGVTIPSISSTNTITNKRNQKRVYSTTSLATLTPEIDTYDVFCLTAQAEALTIANPSTSTPVNSEMMLIKILDNGTSQSLSYGNQYTFLTSAVLPTGTTVGKTTYILFMYNSSTSKWVCVSVGYDV